MVETPSVSRENNINDLRTLPIALTKHHKGDRILFLLMDDLQVAYGYDEEKIENQKPISSSKQSSKEHILWRFRIVIISLIIISVLIATVIINELTNSKVITKKYNLL